MSILLFSRPVRTGKTTELTDWCRNQKDIAGVLMPDTEGNRKIYNLATKEIFELECSDPGNAEEELISVGRFSFYADVFSKVNRILVDSLKDNPRWFVIDEVGKLELNKSGFYDAVSTIVNAYHNKTISSNILLVVRESLLNEVIEFFTIIDPLLVHDLKDPSLNC